MIQIYSVAKELESFFEKRNIDTFKIFIRLSNTIDTFFKSDKYCESDDMYKDFKNFLTLKAEKEYVRSVISDSDVKINFFCVQPEEVKDPYYRNVFNGTNGISWGPRFRFDSLLNKHQQKAEDQNTGKTPIVTFYSYKGGMGRTTTMVAYAMDLAINKNKSVVIVDCDLEAPGYLNFFDLSEHKALKEGKCNGLVEFLCDSQFVEEPNKLNIEDYIINIGKDNDKESAYNNLKNIWLVPAGNLNEDLAEESDRNEPNEYLEGLARINLSNVEAVVTGFKHLFSKIIDLYEPDVILLDSRTGFNDVFGTVAFNLATTVVGFLGFSRQTHPGMMHLIKEYYKPEHNFNLNIVFSIIPQNEEAIVTEQKQKDFNAFLNRYMTEDKDRPKVSYLHRNDVLEEIGTGETEKEEQFVNLIKNVDEQYKDYRLLFDEINNSIFEPEPEELPQTPKQLRDEMLRHLANILKDIKIFTEQGEFVESRFFYRECMKELFKKEKYLIQGYKGTGKTCLYTALCNETVSKTLQYLAGEPETMGIISVNVLPLNNSGKYLPYESIIGQQSTLSNDSDYYFHIFWQIHSWKAACPISVTVLGIFTDTNSEQPSKANVPIGVTSFWTS